MLRNTWSSVVHAMRQPAEFHVKMGFRSSGRFKPLGAATPLLLLVFAALQGYFYSSMYLAVYSVVSRLRVQDAAFPSLSSGP